MLGFGQACAWVCSGAARGLGHPLSLLSCTQGLPPHRPSPSKAERPLSWLPLTGGVWPTPGQGGAASPTVAGHLPQSQEGVEGTDGPFSPETTP